MTVFLTPAGEPFYAGTYFPPEPRHGMPSFPQLLLAVAEAWQAQRDDIVAQARRLVDAVASLRPDRSRPPSRSRTRCSTRPSAGSLARSSPSTAASAGRRSSRPPRRSSSSCAAARRRRWRWWRRRSTGWRPVGCTTSSAAASTATRSTSGGSCRTSRRCSTTTRCSPPTYLHAFVVTGEQRYRAIVEETLDYMVRELRLPEGGLASAQDADTNGVEGLTFTWTEEEGVPAELLQPFEHGRSIIRGSLDPELRARLLAERELRPQPGLDDKVLASWNGLALAALAEGARRLERADWLEAARRRGGVPARAALPRRRAPLALLAGGEGERRGLPRRLRERRARAARAPPRDRRARAGCTRRTASRCSPSSSSTIPSTAASSSRRPGARSSWPARRASTTTRFRPATRCSRTCCCGSAGSGATTSSSGSASRCCGSWRRRSTRAPGAFGWTLCALDLWLSPPREIAIVGPADSAVARAALAPFAPNTVVAIGPADGVPLLEGKGLVDGKPAVYVCERFACQAPVTDADCRFD